MTTSSQHHPDAQATKNETRREFLKYTAAGVGGTLVAAAPTANAADSMPEQSPMPISRKAFDAFHKLKPLSFNPARLNGLSRKIIESHWEHNYGGSVRALNAVKEQLAAALADKDTPAFLYNGLKREHLMRTGSVILHELYFDNLGGSGRADQKAREFISRSFGNFDRWESEFRRIAGGLGGGSGWVILGYNRHFQTLENFWMADHMHYPAMTKPILVIDMYEHSYQMDFGAATARYIDAFFNNINWEIALERMNGTV